MLLRKLHDCAIKTCLSSVFARTIIWAIHLLIFVGCGISAFLVRFDLAIDRGAIGQICFALPVWIAVKTIVFRAARLDRGWWRYVSIPDLLRVVIANVVASMISTVIIVLAGPAGFSRAVYIIDLFLCIYATGGVRLLARMLRDPTLRGTPGASGKRVLIYGAGSAGFWLVREILATPQPTYDIRGFIDDNPLKRGMTVHRLTVLGGGSDIASIAARENIEEVLIAIPSASAQQMTRILHFCHDAGVRCQTVPSVWDLIEGAGLTNQIRDVAVEDLLSRSTVHLIEDGIRAKLSGKVIVVTGGGGSIGSELCRQIARFEPRAVVAYDISETSLFQLEHEMGRVAPHVPFRYEIGSIRNRQRVAEVFDRYRPAVVYHAAAYKHVPMMETHLFEAVENNVLGTWNVATVAADYDVEDFVMISSDKAVRPTSVMGMTKRLSEVLINSLHGRGVKYVSVRFGNVLGSNGSVVPLFKQQIATGGPVTVTHPEMRRYFMTVLEAVQLVLQASTMGKGGEIFVLDMGQPIKILDLAKNLILLSGRRPDTDIRIQFTGVRAGEKLFEEISALEEDTVPTYHEKIKIFSGNGVPPEGMEPHIAVIRELCAMRDAKGLMSELRKLVPEYTPSRQVLTAFMSGADTIAPMSASAVAWTAAASSR
jgi:FlaA1/EpsC-like NDP-sugar epimerase